MALCVSVTYGALGVVGVVGGGYGVGVVVVENGGMCCVFVRDANTVVVADIVVVAVAAVVVVVWIGVGVCMCW